MPEPEMISRTQLLAECGPLPLPGGGRTRERWERLASVARRDLALAKLVEPHHDAAAILAELGGPEIGPGEAWAVWAAEPPFAVLRAVRSGDAWRLTGQKAFCSGASVVTHALVTAETEDGPGLFAMLLDDEGIAEDPDATPWVGPGMRRAGTEGLVLDDVPAVAVGAAGAYTARPGFWWGAIGIAACWLGGTLGVADVLEAGAGRLGPHGLAHLGAVRAGTESLALALDAAADRADSDELDAEEVRRLALVLRARAAELAEEVISRTGRATGPGPLAFDQAHATRVADLMVFVRQHHAERDLAQLGAMT